jgi:hypothetical protein
MTKQYEFRKLEPSDLFMVIRLVKKIGLDNLSKSFEGQKIASLLQDGSNETQIGMAVVFDIAQVVIDRIADCENEIYDLLEKTSNLTKKEIKSLDIDVFIQMIIDFVQKEDFKKAFTTVMSLFK